MARQDFASYQYGQGRLDLGVQMIQKCMLALLKRNDLKHEGLAKFCRWANPWSEQWMSTSQISNLRTGKLLKPGPQTWFALGETNLRIAQIAGDRSPSVLALPDFGPVPLSIRRLLPDNPWFLRHPVTKEPLTRTGLSGVFLGEIIPDGFGDDEISQEDASALSIAILAMFDNWVKRRDLKYGPALRQALAAYGDQDQGSLQRIREVLEGEYVFTPEEVTKELQACSGMVALFLGSDELLSVDDVRACLSQFDN